MIISHEHRFIFLHVPKTAGSSIEGFLAPLAGESATCTPLEPPLAGHQPRNYERHFNPVPDMVRNRRIRGPVRQSWRKRAYFNHIDAERLRGRVGRRVWNSYFKFCFERDPWDKTVSWYYFQMTKRTSPTDFRDFVLHERLPTSFSQYSIGGQLAVDFVGRYERLSEDLATALVRVGLDTPITLGRAKSESRPAQAAVESLFTPELDRRISRVFAREIEQFGYGDRSQPVAPVSPTDPPATSKDSSPSASPIDG